jgi:GNAT superfamily N-acetyltransferase
MLDNIKKEEKILLGISVIGIAALLFYKPTNKKVGLSDGKVKLPVKYEYEHVDSYQGQNNHAIGIYRQDKKGPGGGIIGIIEFVTYGKEISVDMIRVRDEYKRKGVASRLHQKMREKYPNYKKQSSLLTEDGAKLKYKRISKDAMNYIYI